MSATVFAPARPATSAGLIAAGAVRSVYQPVVRLPERRVVAYEALARGPVGSPLESPAALFSAAAAEGLVAELDQACRMAAVGGALQPPLDPATALLVNVEPDRLDAAVPAADAPPLGRAERRLTLIAGITERRLADRPADLLRAVAAQRARGWGFALDDVGADWRSVALMPFLRPDLVKLDMRLLQEPSAPRRRPSSARCARTPELPARRSSPRGSRPRSTSAARCRGARRSGRTATSWSARRGR
jgi:EAL domain-containing protein (putative c-di-GMP-specific phosphodiesterase class I)